jgi:hypothetical protein
MLHSSRLRRSLVIGVSAATVLSLLVLSSLAGATHVRPKAATPLYTSYVLAYDECTAAAATTVHGGTFAGGGFVGPSCPPVKTSPWLTVGTPDANGLASGFVGSSKLVVTAAPADIKMDVSITDVHCDAPGPMCVGGGGFPAAYTGTVGVHYLLRITDHCNTPPGPPPPCPPPPGTAATVRDLPFLTPVRCIPTGPPPAGSTCALSTTWNSILPGAITPTMRMNVRTHEVHVTDGGADGDATTADAAQERFLYEGVFVP